MASSTASMTSLGADLGDRVGAVFPRVVDDLLQLLCHGFSRLVKLNKSLCH